MHGDVFRAPKNPNLLSVLVGSGVQLLAMVVITLCACTLSLLSSWPFDGVRCAQVSRSSGSCRLPTAGG